MRSTGRQAKRKRRGRKKPTEERQKLKTKEKRAGKKIITSVIQSIIKV